MKLSQKILALLTTSFLSTLISQPVFASLIIDHVQVGCDYSRTVHLVNLDFSQKAPVLVTTLNALDQGFAGAEANAGNSSFMLDAHCGYCAYSCTYYHNGMQNNAGSVHISIQSGNNAPLDLIFSIQNTNPFSPYKTRVFALPNTNTHLELVSNQPTSGRNGPIVLAFKST